MEYSYLGDYSDYACLCFSNCKRYEDTRVSQKQIKKIIHYKNSISENQFIRKLIN